MPQINYSNRSCDKNPNGSGWIRNTDWSHDIPLFLNFIWILFTRVLIFVCYHNGSKSTIIIHILIRSPVNAGFLSVVFARYAKQKKLPKWRWIETSSDVLYGNLNVPCPKLNNAYIKYWYVSAYGQYKNEVNSIPPNQMVPNKQ